MFCAFLLSFFCYLVHAPPLDSVFLKEAYLARGQYLPPHLQRYCGFGYVMQTPTGTLGFWVSGKIVSGAARPI